MVILFPLSELDATPRPLTLTPTSQLNQSHRLTVDGIRASGRFIKGIAATPEDVTSYRAVFSAGPNARPLDLDIPQYAMFEDKETGERSLHIITQAEEANGFRLIGALRASDGKELAGFESDFKFLGQVPPV